MRASLGFFATCMETAATPGVYTSERSARLRTEIAGCIRIFPPSFLWSANAFAAVSFFAMDAVYFMCDRRNNHQKALRLACASPKRCDAEGRRSHYGAKVLCGSHHAQYGARSEERRVGKECRSRWS